MTIYSAYKTATTVQAVTACYEETTANIYLFPGSSSFYPQIQVDMSRLQGPSIAQKLQTFEYAVMLCKDLHLTFRCLISNFQIPLNHSRWSCVIDDGLLFLNPACPTRMKPPATAIP